MAEQTVESGVLRGCEAAARSLSESHKAFKLWCVARAVGWPEARRLHSRASFQRYVRVLKAAGIPVPHKWRDGHSAGGGVSAGWFGAQTEAEALQAVTREPKRVLTLSGACFRTLAGFLPSSQPDLCADIYPAGTLGEVDSVLFRDAAWWVGCIFEDVPGGDYEQLPLGYFLRFTAPQAGEAPADGG